MLHHPLQTTRQVHRLGGSLRFRPQPPKTPRFAAIRLTKAGRQFALAHVLHSKQKFTKDDGDTYTMNTPPITRHLVVEWILAQRGNAVPLSPAELVEDVRTTSQRITEACTRIQEEGK